MQQRFSTGKRVYYVPLNRVKDINLGIPQIRADFFVRLFSLLGAEPEISFEGYDFFIEDNQNGKMFSAGLTGFGLGYFAADETEETKQMIDDFHDELFDAELKMKTCQNRI